MLTGNRRSMEFLVAITVTVAACGRGKGLVVAARDSGTNTQDMLSSGDLPADPLVTGMDLAGDGTGVVTDGRPNTSPDVATVVDNDVGPDNRILDRDGLGTDATTEGRDAVRDMPRSGIDGATLDTTQLSRDADMDATAPRTDTATGDGLAPGYDAGGIDLGLEPLLTISPTAPPLILGLDAPSDPVLFIVNNVGPEVSGAFTVTITGSRFLKITSNSCTQPLPPGQSCQVSVVFDAPGGAGSASATLRIAAYGAPGGAFTVEINADAV